MTEACRCLLGYLFEQGYEKVRIDAMIENIGSIRVIEKCGGELFETAEDERKLIGDKVMLNRYLIRKSPD